MMLWSGVSSGCQLLKWQAVMKEPRFTKVIGLDTNGTKRSGCHKHSKV